MHIVLDLKLLLLIGAANAAPLMTASLFGGRFSYPLDGHAKLADSQPLFGRSKSVRGIVVSLLATAVAAPVLGMAWWIGLLIAAAAMAGDLLSSFVKRRLKLAPSSMALGLDQLPESLLPLLACAMVLPLSFADIVAVVAAFFVLELLLSRLLFMLDLRDTPY